MGVATSSQKRKSKENGMPVITLKKATDSDKNIPIEIVRQSKKYYTEKQFLKNHLIKLDDKKNIKEVNEYKSKNVKTSDGKTLDDYILLKVIGRGNFGKVILVKSKLNNEFYALKSMKKAEILKLKCENLINTEKRVLERTDHPFIIKLHLTFQTPEKLYMVFDYNNGGELFFHLQHKTRFNEDLVRFYGAQLYLALSYLHFNNIIYRDIKPENIILDNMGYIKLIDFGLSKDKFYSDSLTGTICGTSEYLGI
jgi:serine/threonine protein kinase